MVRWNHMILASLAALIALSGAVSAQTLIPYAHYRLGEEDLGTPANGGSPELGLTLDEIASELSRLPANRVPEQADWAKLSGSWTKRIDERIAELERLRAGLTQCIGCGCLSLKQCQLANPDDRMGRIGPGPRFWIGGKQKRA